MKTNAIIKLTTATVALGVFLSGSARAADASAIWTKTCAACHGKDGKGNTRMGRKVDVKDYTDPKVQAELKDDEAIKAIKGGIKDDKGKERMKAYGDQLSDDEVKSLVAYMRAFKSK
jgi:cytochrome c553